MTDFRKQVPATVPTRTVDGGPPDSPTDDGELARLRAERDRLERLVQAADVADAEEQEKERLRQEIGALEAEARRLGVAKALEADALAKARGAQGQFETLIEERAAYLAEREGLQIPVGEAVVKFRTDEKIAEWARRAYESETIRLSRA